MRKETIQLVQEELAAEYENVSRTVDGARTLVKIPTVHFPFGCAPTTASALIVLDEAQAAPQLFLNVLPILPNGKAPRSVSNATFGGQCWHGFSFNQPWEENTHTAVQFVEGRLRRFSMAE